MCVCECVALLSSFFFSNLTLWVSEMGIAEFEEIVLSLIDEFLGWWGVRGVVRYMYIYIAKIKCILLESTRKIKFFRNKQNKTLRAC